MFNYFKKNQIKSLTKKISQLRQVRAQLQPKQPELENEIKLYYKLAKVYESCLYDKVFPNADLLMLECYRSASLLGDIQASYLFGKALLEKGKFWQRLSKSIFACKAHEKYAADAFEEAFTYLNEAVKHKHVLAKRLCGLAEINGWGLQANLEKGFEIIIESIEQEGAWDRATQIFEELGLNRPEFFAYLSRRKS